MKSQPAWAETGAGVALVTGGAGFIGANVADRMMREGWNVVVLDNLSRRGTETNLKWLQEHHGDRLRFEQSDIRDAGRVAEAVDRADRIIHLAAQVAVTTSLDAPLDDFEVNGRGTLNLLEAMRRREDPPPLLFTSTNKVYGGLEDIGLAREDHAYRPIDPDIRARGIGEERRLSFCSPYGCSKGSADQYVLDYARTFGLPATVFRMSCIYGPRQFGNEDQGWVAHFLIQALRNNPITLFGDGHQVRDVLYVDDLVEGVLAAFDHMDRLRGTAFNIGGGAQNTLSLLQLITMIETLQGTTPELHFEPWRASDQRYYVSDFSRFGETTGWQPRIGVEEGVRRLHRWLADHHGFDAGQRRVAL